MISFIVSLLLYHVLFALVAFIVVLYLFFYFYLLFLFLMPSVPGYIISYFSFCIHSHKFEKWSSLMLLGCIIT